jgi:hypothetical protein
MAPMDKQERQRKLETDALQDGLVEYRDAVARLRPGQSNWGIEFLRSALGSLASAVAQQQIKIGQGKGKLPAFAIPLVSLDPEKLACNGPQNLDTKLAFS